MANFKLGESLNKNIYDFDFIEIPHQALGIELASGGKILWHGSDISVNGQFKTDYLITTDNFGVIINVDSQDFEKVWAKVDYSMSA